MSAVENVVSRANFAMLRKQKLSLVRRMFKLNKRKHLTNEEKDEHDYLQGIINFLDAIQDAVVKDGIKTERQVFGKMED